MARPIDTLRAEHVLVERGADVLVRVGEHVRAGGPFPSDDVALLLRFLREFLVAGHFRKEGESVLPAAAMLGNELVAGQVGEVLRMQQEVTDLVHSLMLFWEPTGELTAAERAGFHETIVTLALRLRRLRAVEEETLFPVCNASVPGDDQIEWSNVFARLEHRLGGPGVWARPIEVLAQTWARPA